MKFFTEVFFTKLFNLIKNSKFINWLESSTLYKFFLWFKAKITSSILAFSLFILWGTFSLAATRLFYMWYFSQWQYLELYCYSVTFSFIGSLILIAIRYAQVRGFGERSIRNSERWRAYQKHLILKHDIQYLFTVRRISWWSMFISSIFVALSGSNNSLPILFVLPLSISQLIICYYVLKTPFPDNLLLEPPAFFEKICQKPVINKILIRHYSSQKGASAAFTGGSKVAWYLAIGTSAVVTSAFSVRMLVYRP